MIEIDCYVKLRGKKFGGRFLLKNLIRVDDYGRDEIKKIFFLMEKKTRRVIEKEIPS